MTKKLLSLMLVVCIAMGFGIVPVSAGAPVVLDGTTQVMFDQSFGGLSDASDLTDFTVSGSGWSYMSDFMIADGGSRSIISKANYDVSDAAQWTFTSKQSCTYNGYYLKLAYDEANSKGYVLAYSRTTKKLALFRDTGYGYTEAKVANAVATAAIDAYNTDVTITVTYTKATNTLKVSNSKNSNIIEYTPDDGYEPSLNGKFGVEGASAGVFTVFNMSLVKAYDSVTVDQWRYDKTFTAANTQTELEADGFTFSKATTPNESGLYTSGKTITFGPNGKDISGDYYFETKIYRKQNYYTLDFNKSDAGYYRIEYGRNKDGYNRPWVRLYKYDASTGLTHILVNFDKETIPSGLTRTYKGTVKTLDDGSVDINIGVYNENTLEYTLAYTDTKDDTVSVTTTTTVVDEEGNTVYEDDGVTPKTEEITEDVNTGEPLASGKLRMIDNSAGGYIKYLNAYSIMNEEEQESGTEVTEVLIDETLNSEDTVDSLKEKGITFQTTPTLNEGYIATDKFMYYSNSSLGDKYTISFSAHRNYNKSEIYFNYVDSNNYYFLDFGHGSRCFKLKKKINGGDVITLTEYVSTSASSYRYGYMGWTDYTIEVVPNAARTELYIKISTKCTHDTKGAQTALPALEYTDTLTDVIGEVDTGAPIFDGGFRQKHASEGRLGYFKIEHTIKDTTGLSTNGEEPVFVGRFSNDTGAIKEISKDNIYFEYPTALFGKYTVVAALYEDYKMTELKTFEPIDIYSGKVKLFDTTNSTAENMKVRVYFLDSGETLNLVADEVYELK